MWYNSAMTYDMVTAGPWNNMNLHMNQLYDHSIAWNNMFQYPQYNFNNFMPYGDGFGCNSYLTNPFYTLNQMSWGTPAWGNNFGLGGGNMGMNYGMPGMFGWGGTPFGQVAPSTGGSAGSGNSKTNSKYNRLLSLVNQMIKNDNNLLTATEIDTLTAAKKNSKGTADEKFEKLLEAYNTIPKDVVRKFLAESSGKLKVADKADSFYETLLGAGHEYIDKGVDPDLDKIYDGIAALKDKNAGSVDVDGVVSELQLGTTDVLDLISSWNTEFKSNKGSERLIKHLEKSYNGLKDDDAKEDVKNKILLPLINALTAKADTVKGALDSASKKRIQNAIDDLKKEKDKSKISFSTISNKFDELYLLTRQAALTKLQNDAKSYWGEIDSKVFNNELFKDEMMEDLDGEGFSAKDIKDASVSVRETRRTSSRSESDNKTSGGNDEADDLKDVMDDKTAAEQLVLLEKAGYLEETTYKKDGTMTVYREKKMTGDSDGKDGADYARLFYVNKEGKLVEWTNTKLNDACTNVEVAKVGSVQKELTVKGSEIMSYKAKVEEAEEKAEAEAESTGSFNAKTFGETTAEYLTSFTDDDNCDWIAARLDKLNKDNVLEFLNAYYEKAGYKSSFWGDKTCSEGLIEYLDDDDKDDDNRVFTKELKSGILTAVLEKAEALGLASSQEYKDLKSIIDEHDEYYSDAEHYGAIYKDCTWPKANVKYNEEIDTCLEALHKKMKAEAE